MLVTRRVFYRLDGQKRVRYELSAGLMQFLTACAISLVICAVAVPTWHLINVHERYAMIDDYCNRPSAKAAFLRCDLGWCGERDDFVIEALNDARWIEEYRWEQCGIDRDVIQVVPAPAIQTKG